MVRLLGLDPGLRFTGWGVIDVDGNRLRHIADGVIATEAIADVPLRLKALDDALAELLDRYLPDEAARQRIAKAGCLRAARDGYHNDRQVQLIVERAQSILSKLGKTRPSEKTAHAGSR